MSSDIAGLDLEREIIHLAKRCIALERSLLEAGIHLYSPDPCEKCGQVDENQQGEHPCPVCRVPTLHWPEDEVPL